MELEPESLEWPMLRANLNAYTGYFELAKEEFNHMLKMNPFFCVMAYDGLMKVDYQEGSSEDLRIIERRVEKAMRLCHKENAKTYLRDFKMLCAQIQVLRGRYDDVEIFMLEFNDDYPKLIQQSLWIMHNKKT